MQRICGRFFWSHLTASNHRVNLRDRIGGCFIEGGVLRAKAWAQIPPHRRRHLFRLASRSIRSNRRRCNGIPMHRFVRTQYVQREQGIKQLHTIHFTAIIYCTRLTLWRWKHILRGRTRNHDDIRALGQHATAPTLAQRLHMQFLRLRCAEFDWRGSRSEFLNSFKRTILRTTQNSQS